ncbi:hypothetical protein GCK72_024313 [Caenorhabditis remanei]|uniref:Uncharacterized protein n=1 Tax=Caenorhabditis remanei TaxID=31234 RepID=A0A6A5FZ04_CAERE|nr:hypothetical protein GCK72_024313 [Caenorhabditis remanei]KAF1747847.1 hypothetical protein GCK72_024313 [Caenorhabditis remanei]
MNVLHEALIRELIRQNLEEFDVGIRHLEDEFTSGSGYHSDLSINSNVTSSSSSDDQQYYLYRDDGVETVDEVFETDEEDIIDRMNRLERGIAGAESDSPDSLDDHESHDGSMQVSSIWSNEFTSDDEYQDELISFNPLDDHDSGYDADEEDEDGNPDEHFVLNILL